MSALPALRGDPLDATAVLFGLRVGYSFIPGVAVVSAERGVRVSHVDQSTQRRSREWYSTTGGTLPFTYASYVWSREPGISRGITAPYCGFGFNPMHGRQAFIFIPGVFCVTITARGEIGLQLSPLRFLGFFFGWSLFVNHPKLKVLTSPVLDRIEWVCSVTMRIVRPVLTPVLSWWRRRFPKKPAQPLLPASTQA